MRYAMRKPTSDTANTRGKRVIANDYSKRSTQSNDESPPRERKQRERTRTELGTRCGKCGGGSGGRKGKGHTPVIQADSENIAKRAEQMLTAEPYGYKVVRRGLNIMVVWHE